MDLLHNLMHNWPANLVKVLLGTMLVNPKARAGGFYEADFLNEHYNKLIKELIQGSKVAPELLNRQTAAIAPVWDLTDTLFSDLGVEARTAHHAKMQVS
jgi:hypothetical protein